MRVIMCIILCIILSGVEAFAQTQIARGETNKFMSLDIKKTTTVKRIKYFEHDNIIFNVRSYRSRFKGTITNLTDTTLTIDSTTIVLYKDITKVLVDNNNSVTKVSRAFLMTAGVGYITLDALNNAINSNSTIVNPKTVVIGVSLIITGQMVKWLSVSRYKINNTHRIKYIDDKP
ncbi:MAG: hypothetical protein ACYDCN_11710 [Bacteroidia bacterium]